MLPPHFWPFPESKTHLEGGETVLRLGFENKTTAWSVMNMLLGGGAVSLTSKSILSYLSHDTEKC